MNPSCTKSALRQNSASSLIYTSVQLLFLLIVEELLPSGYSILIVQRTETAGAGVTLILGTLEPPSQFEYCIDR